MERLKYFAGRVRRSWRIYKGRRALATYLKSDDYRRFVAAASVASGNASPADIAVLQEHLKPKS